MANTSLLLPAIVPDERTKDLIEDVRQNFASKYHCKAALKPPIHITLVPPFKVEIANEAAILDLLNSAIIEETAFNVHLKNYGTFPKNHVVFIGVNPNDKLNCLQRNIEQSLLALPELSIRTQPAYHPHLTIGRKDIPHALFPIAAKEYLNKSFEASFRCDKVVLFKHDGALWRPHSIYQLQASLYRSGFL